MHPSETLDRPSVDPASDLLAQTSGRELPILARLGGLVVGFAVTMTMACALRGSDDAASADRIPSTAPPQGLESKDSDGRPATGPTPPAEDISARWACEEDRDCTQTCALGAVNSTWLKSHAELDTCDDGCGWNQKVVCRDRVCTTLDEHGAVIEDCTRISDDR